MGPSQHTLPVVETALLVLFYEIFILAGHLLTAF
jgi:hypothetical protein